LPDVPNSLVDDGELALETASELTDELRSKVEDLIDHVEIIDIRPCHMTAVLNNEAIPASLVDKVNAEMAVAFTAGPGIYANRFEYRFELIGEAALETLGTIEFTLVVDYRVDDGYEPDHDAASYFSSTTGYFAAYPYARELFASLASRLQFDPMVLGLIRRGTLKPGAISVLRCRPELDNDTDAEEDAHSED
jgi:hypothetical protein